MARAASRTPRAHRGARSGASIRLLGGFAAYRRERELRLPAASRRLLALAALQRHALLRAAAAERLWPHLSQHSARSSLRTAISRLRAVEPDLLSVAPERVTLAPMVAVDVRETEALARRLVAGPLEDEAADAILDALALPLLPGFEDDWVQLERDRLQDLFLHAVEAHAARLLEARSFAPALAAVHAVLAVDPLRESAVYTQLATYLAEGNRASAARSYRHFRARLRASLGMDPSAEMRALMAPFAWD